MFDKKATIEISDYDDNPIKDRLNRIERELILHDHEYFDSSPAPTAIMALASMIDETTKENKSLRLALKALEWRIRVLEEYRIPWLEEEE